MKMYAKGSQKYATEVLYVKSNKLYTDEAKEKELKKANAAKLQPRNVVISDGTNYIAVTSMAIDGSKISAGGTDYTVSE